VILTEDQRLATFGTSSLLWAGLEAGGLLRLGEFDLSASLSWIGYDTKNAIAGLARLQVVPSISFSLPIRHHLEGRKRDTAGILDPCSIGGFR
jgi:hypothetical protein